MPNGSRWSDFRRPICCEICISLCCIVTNFTINRAPHIAAVIFLTYEIADYWHVQYKPAKKNIAKKFGLLPFGLTIKGTKYTGIEWDVWSGIIFVAKNDRVESLIKEIAEFCENKEI